MLKLWVEEVIWRMTTYIMCDQFSYLIYENLIGQSQSQPSLKKDWPHFFTKMKTSTLFIWCSHFKWGELCPVRQTAYCHVYWTIANGSSYCHMVFRIKSGTSEYRKSVLHYQSFSEFLLVYTKMKLELYVSWTFGWTKQYITHGWFSKHFWPEPTTFTRSFDTLAVLHPHLENHINIFRKLI